MLILTDVYERRRQTPEASVISFFVAKFLIQFLMPEREVARRHRAGA